MRKLLYLTHRIPYPPNKGDKIRSFNWLKGLARHYKIYLGTFIDDPEDEQYRDALSEFCEDVHISRLSPLSAKLKSLRGLMTGEALTIPYYRDPALQAWVNETVKQQGIEKALVFSSSMAQYIEKNQFSRARRVIDFVDVDSEKWRQYAENKSWPASFIYNREADKLLQYERKIAKIFDASVFVSEAEAHSFKAMLSHVTANVTFANNGVDADYFSPERGYHNPYSSDIVPLVFTGAMDYWANVDAVCWFAKEVLPLLRREQPNCTFYIVGSKPAPEVVELKKQEGVVVTGRVEDVRPFIVHAKMAVAPMRIARGIQNKVLEAMAMAKPVIASPQGYEGIEAEVDKEIWVADKPADYVRYITRLIEQGDKGMGRRARERVIKDYSWDANVAKLIELLEA